MASALFIQYRNYEDIKKEDLGSFPLNLAKFEIDYEEKTVTASVLGFAKKKAIYRPGLGCTLINDFSEEEVRSQKMILPTYRANRRLDDPFPVGENLYEGPFPYPPFSSFFPKEIDSLSLNTAIDYAMNYSEKNKSAYTRAVLVLYNGKIAGEKYAPGFHANKSLLGWSISKSLTAAMIGILVKQGKLDINAPAPVSEWKGTKKEKITIKQLLQQTSGIRFTEDYTKACEVTNMLFKHGDMAAYTAKLPLKHQPGTVFNYSSGNTNILSRIIRQKVGSNYAAFPYMALFNKINAYSFLLEPDASGTYIGSSYSYATARDFARFALLYYNNGKWGDEQILPENWVQESIQPSSADKQKHYGYQFWLNGYDEKDPKKRWYPSVPADMYFADGYGGQDIYIIPSKKLIVLRFGLHKINEDEFLKRVIESIK